MNMATPLGGGGTVRTGADVSRRHRRSERSHGDPGDGDGRHGRLGAPNHPDGRRRARLRGEHHGATGVGIPSVEAVNEAFGKRAAPAILGLIGRVDTLNAGLGDFTGTAMENGPRARRLLQQQHEARVGDGGRVSGRHGRRRRRSAEVRRRGGNGRARDARRLAERTGPQDRGRGAGGRRSGHRRDGAACWKRWSGSTPSANCCPAWARCSPGWARAWRFRSGWASGSGRRWAGLAGQGLMTAGRLAASSNAVRGMFRTLNAGITAGRRGFLGMFGFLGPRLPAGVGTLAAALGRAHEAGPCPAGDRSSCGCYRRTRLRSGQARRWRSPVDTVKRRSANNSPTSRPWGWERGSRRTTTVSVTPSCRLTKPSPQAGSPPTPVTCRPPPISPPPPAPPRRPTLALRPPPRPRPRSPLLPRRRSQTVPPKPEPTPGPPLLLPGATPATMTGTAPAPAADVLPAGTAGGVQLWVPSWTGASPLAVGAQAGQDALVNQTADTAQRVRDFYPSSDAKVGPLSDLTAAGMAIPGTIAAGMAVGSPMLLDATTTMLGAARALLPAGSPEMGLGGHLLPAGTGGLPPVPAPAPGEGAEPIADSAGAPVLADALRILAERTAENTRALARIERRLDRSARRLVQGHAGPRPLAGHLSSSVRDRPGGVGITAGGTPKSVPKEARPNGTPRQPERPATRAGGRGFLVQAFREVRHFSRTRGGTPSAPAEPGVAIPRRALR